MEVADPLGTDDGERRAEALGSYKPVLCPVLFLKEFTAVHVPGFMSSRGEAAVCESCPRAWPLGRELSEQPHLLPSPTTAVEVLRFAGVPG